MRSPSWRLFIACLLLLVLPMQGFAAVTALGCHGEPTHAVAPSVVAADMQVGMHAHHHDPMATAESSATPTDHADPAVHAMHGAGKTEKCSSCSPCCAGALVNTVSAPRVAVAPASGTFHYPSSANPSPTLAGLDRPPRHTPL